MFFVKPPYLAGKLLFPLMKWRFPNNDKCIYLTFDDGPEPEVTPWVLEQLKEFNAKATFFCVGKNVSTCQDIYSSILKNGHSVGNHTFNHFNGWKTPTPDYLKNIDKCAELIDSSLFRPPYGRLKPAQYAQLVNKYSIIMWDVLSGDYSEKVSKEQCLENVIKHTKAGSIVVFHDSVKAKISLKYALPEVLKYFTEKGFEFRAITPKVLN